jgi:hypothetical protein
LKIIILEDYLFIGTETHTICALLHAFLYKAEYMSTAKVKEGSTAKPIKLEMHSLTFTYSI